MLYTVGNAPDNPARKSQTDAPPRLSLTTPVQYLKGVGPRLVPLFEKLDVRTLADLLDHIPHRYEQEYAQRPIGELVGDQIVSTTGEVGSTQVVTGRYGRRPRFEARLLDETGTMVVTWFNAAYLRNTIQPGMRIRIHGKTKRSRGHVQMINPRWEKIDENDPPPARDDRYRPVYHATDGLTSLQIDAIIQRNLDQALPLIEDPMPAHYLKQRELPSRSQAYRLLHHPDGESDVASGRRRLALDELLLLQLGVAMRRSLMKNEFMAPALNTSDAIDKHITDRFPFELTPSQREVIEELRSDLAQPVPMNRLLQGDVGSGKTVVALYAVLTAIASGYQAAIMAPTEILAEQHFLTMTEMLAGSKVRIELLVGSLSDSHRADVVQRLRNGDVDLIIGTHAILSKPVQFAKLGVSIIDEQHRFGVEQRAQLRQRTDEATNLHPHTLVMTATPIPRTLSLTLFGDLDVSTIRHLPPGRTAITTRVVTPEQTDTVYAYVADRIRKRNEQAYIVLPMIDESTTTTGTSLKDVQSHVKWLEDGPFAGLKIAAIHGRRNKDARDRIMHQFRNGRIDALVATTVIEVGVDVPNATIMIVEHADRFGLSQLHQLRGRVGRGTKRSLCTFIADPTTDDAKARMEAIGSTTDGFIIAEKDFEIRGMGEIFGTRQAGLAPFRITELPRDIELLRMARRDARAWIEDDPRLAKPQNAAIRKLLMETYGGKLGLADVG